MSWRFGPQLLPCNAAKLHWKNEATAANRVDALVECPTLHSEVIKACETYSWLIAAQQLVRYLFVKPGM
jgi:hypothetical protein